MQICIECASLKLHRPHMGVLNLKVHFFESHVKPEEQMSPVPWLGGSIVTQFFLQSRSVGTFLHTSLKKGEKRSDQMNYDI